MCPPGRGGEGGGDDGEEREGAGDRGEERQHQLPGPGAPRVWLQGWRGGTSAAETGVVSGGGV